MENGYEVFYFSPASGLACSRWDPPQRNEKTSPAKSRPPNPTTPPVPTAFPPAAPWILTPEWAMVIFERRRPAFTPIASDHPKPP